MTDHPANNAVANDSGWRLKLVVVVSGAVLMGLELTGSRVIAAHFGSSIYVWGAIIGVFLSSLAAGYYLGGHLADWRPNFALLNLLLLIAGAWLLAIPIYANWLCRGVRQANLGVRLGPLVATLVLFGGPSVLMGMVSPFAVRLAARTLERMGNLSGRLYALSTFGSIIGTMVTAFWLIPLMGVRSLMQVLGLCLLVLPFIVLPKSRRLVVSSVPLLIVVAGLFFLGTRKPTLSGDRRIVYEADSAYHQILVVDDLRLKERYLQFNNNPESGIDLNPPHETRFIYTDAFHLARIFQPDLKRVLIIGGGGGVSARKFVTEDPGVVVDLVEIDPLVVEVSFKYFFLQPDERLRVHTEDGRSFVRRALERDEKYDLVVLDAYTLGSQIPFHLTTREFMEEVRGVLTPDGVLLANIVNAMEGPGSRVMRSEYKTLAAVFNQLYLFPLPRKDEQDQTRAIDPLRRRNIILIAANGPGGWSRESLVAAAGNIRTTGPGLKNLLVAFAQQFSEGLPPTDGCSRLDGRLRSSRYDGVLGLGFSTMFITRQLSLTSNLLPALQHALRQAGSILVVLFLFTAISCQSPPPAGLIGQRVIPIFGYEVVQVWPHDTKAYTQGLVFHDGNLLESTGQVGQSSLRRVEIDTGKVLQNVNVPAPYFAEGITLLNGKIYQLTWQHGVGFFYDAWTLEKLGQFTYPGEGWGLTNDGQSLILSDGTYQLRFLDPDNFQVQKTMRVGDGSKPLSDMNELEYVQGEIYANVWHTDRIARINAQTGMVVGWIDLTGLLASGEVQDQEAVLNGIAYDETNGRLFVTGKLWPKLFEIRLTKK